MTRSGTSPWPPDPNQIASGEPGAVHNVVINARDAMPDGGRLLIATANIVLPDRRAASRDAAPDNVPAGEYVVLSVTDTGRGMSRDVLTRAFDPFFTTKPIGQGTGLGLSMIYGFVQQSGGHVRLHSEEGQGTTVEIYLPRHLGAMENEEEGATGHPPRAETRGVVLVVEDEPAVRMIILDVLTEAGYTVLEAGDGRAGLRIVESGSRIDLLVTDIGLPGGMNGRQLADAARRRRPELKVLFITGYAGIAGVDDGFLHQDMQLITKPFAVDALAARVQGLLSS